MYVITPTPMMGWMELFKKENIENRPDLLEIVPSNKLNPEKFYYYQNMSKKAIESGVHGKDGYYGVEMDNSLPFGRCYKKTKKEIDEIVDQFESEDSRVAKIYDMLHRHMGIDKLLSIEVNHCP